jgi:hypothetical protein
MPKNDFEKIESLGLLSAEAEGGGADLGGGGTSAPPSSDSSASSSPSSAPGKETAARQESVLADIMGHARGPAETKPPQPVVPSIGKGANGAPPAVGALNAQQQRPPQPPQQYAQPQVQQQAPQQYAQQAPPMTQQQQAAQHAQVRDTVRQQIASSYQLTPDRALMMATEPERVLPDMAADITLNAYEATVATLQQQMPQIIAEHPQIRQQMAHVVQSTIQQMFAVHQAENDFFTVNQDLRQVPKHEIDRISALYIQANRGNPGLTRDIATREIGILVRNMLGLSPNTNAPAPNAPQPPAAQPQYQNGYQNGNSNIVARTPLGPGSVAPSPSPQPNVFADMVNFARGGR